MKYRYTVECCHKTYRMELTVMHVEEDDESGEVNRVFINHCIEKRKAEDGLEGLPHSIIRIEFSLDGDVWFEMSE